MISRDSTVFFGDNGISAAPFADNLPGLQTPGEQHMDDMLLPAGQVAIWTAVLLGTGVICLLLGS